MHLITTSGALALHNLDAQIAGLATHAGAGLLSLATRIEWIEAIAERGHLLGRIADVERANTLAEALRLEHPNEADAWMASARAKARFHLFAEALGDLDEAASTGAEQFALAAERADVLQSVGEFEAALPLLQAAVGRNESFSALGALAVFHAERGEPESAERYFEKSRAVYRGVSPIPLARLAFHRGHMWMSRDLKRAEAAFAEALRLLPAYAPAQGHLAEVEAALGDIAGAVSRLEPLTQSSDDPDYAAALAGILAKAGREVEAVRWRTFAAERYEELIADHPAAFADHVAAFWLEHGGDPQRALAFAKLNLQVRNTPRARRLAERAGRAAIEQGATA